MKKLLAPFLIIQVFCLFVLKDKVIKDSLAQTGNPFASKVILMVWDGTQKNHLNELLTTGQLPNLQNLINEGRIKDMEIYTTNCGCTNDGDNYHTETGPGHIAMLSGYGFPENANHSNFEAGEQCESDCPQYCTGPTVSPCPFRMSYPAPSNPPLNPCFNQLGPNPLEKGRTFFERLKKFNPNIKTGMITGKASKFFPFYGLKHAASSSCCYRMYVMGWNIYCGDNDIDPVDSCLPSNDIVPTVGNRFLNFLDQYFNSPFFLFAHLREPDDYGHAKGENSQEYTNGIIEDDHELGRTIQKLKDLRIYEQTVLLVTTDHGFAEDTTTHHPCVSETKQIWIASNKRNVIDKQGVIAKQTSIVPTLFDIFGMDKNVSPPFPAESLFNPLSISPTPTQCPNPPAPSLNSPANGVDIDFIPNLHINLIVNPISQQCGINQAQYFTSFTFRNNTYGSGWIDPGINGLATWNTGPYNYPGTASWKAKSHYFDTPYNTFRESEDVDSETRTYNIICPKGDLGDFNCDGVIDGEDLMILNAAWTTTGPVVTPLDARRSPDLNGDGKVNETDLTTLMRNWTQ